MKTNKQRTIDGLLALGYQEVNQRSKHRVFVKDDPNRKMWVGRAGALRVGRVSTQTTSITGTRRHKIIMAIGDQEGWSSIGQAEEEYRQQLIAAGYSKS